MNGDKDWLKWSSAKGSYDDVISALDDFSEEPDANTATHMEKVCGLQERLY